MMSSTAKSYSLFWLGNALKPGETQTELTFFLKTFCSDLDTS